MRLPDTEATLAILGRVASAPTAPYHEFQALDAIRREVEAQGFAVGEDAYGQLTARSARGAPQRALALVAHTDHPAFEIVRTPGGLRARILGGVAARFFEQPVKVVVHDDAAEAATFPAVLDDFVPAIDLVHNSPGHCRVRADRTVTPGMWAVMDLPAFETRGDELLLRAADDLALCAVAILVLAELREDARPHDLRVLFTRAEEPGLYGARLVAEDGLLPREACIVSLEASRALPQAVPGGGVVVRAGDLHNTFSNDAERYLRVASARLEAGAIPTQRALLVGGTCEASAFLRLGWSATGIAVPNVNYHNMPERGERFVPEIVRLSDLRGAVALLVEAAAAAGGNEDEAWWPDVRRVPEELRNLLRRTSG